MFALTNRRDERRKIVVLLFKAVYAVFGLTVASDFFSGMPEVLGHPH
jgi:hypothetical protein